MVSSFRNRVPNRSPRLTGFFVNALRWRALQAVGVAALFFALVQMGRVLTGDANLDLSRTPFAFLVPMQVGNLSAPANEVVAARGDVKGRETDRKERQIVT